MEEELISKKELLNKYGISYGALYRWKRMGLIPEDWFLRRSTSTGQETFFYRQQICPRMELILSRSDSLDRLAQELHPVQEERPVRRLVVEDRYSTRSFRMEELQHVKVTEGEREVDLLTYLKGVEL
jgi:predicted type IV restriction endonuclease